jgi:hypothetical protein
LLDQRARDPARVPLLAVLGEQARDLLGGQPGQQLGGRGPRAGIEAHVQGLVTLEREAAPRVVELIRRHPEVEQHRRRTLHARPGGERAEVAEAAPYQHHASAEALEPPRRAREGLGVAIDTEQATLTARLQELLRVSTHADCPVHHPAPASGAQEEHHLVEQHGYVHAQTPLAANRSRRSSSGPAFSRS